MFSGEDFLGLPVDVEDAVKEDSYWCPCCGGDLVIKDGPVKIKHFAHKSRMNCDEWHSDMSEWHREWQKRFQLKNREVVIEHNGEKHRADVCIGSYVIEFQNSPMSREEFDRRTLFYTSAGFKLVWVFNFRDKIIYSRGSRNGSPMFGWDWASKMFGRFDVKRKDVFLYFEIQEFYSDETVLHHVIWFPRIDGYYSPKRFLVNSKGPFRKDKFVSYISMGLLR